MSFGLWRAWPPEQMCIRLCSLKHHAQGLSPCIMVFSFVIAVSHNEEISRRVGAIVLSSLHLLLPLLFILESILCPSSRVRAMSAPSLSNAGQKRPHEECETHCVHRGITRKATVRMAYGSIQESEYICWELSKQDAERHPSHHGIQAQEVRSDG